MPEPVSRFCRSWFLRAETSEVRHDGVRRTGGYFASRRVVSRNSVRRVRPVRGFAEVRLPKLDAW